VLGWFFYSNKSLWILSNPEVERELVNQPLPSFPVEEKNEGKLLSIHPCLDDRHCELNCPLAMIKLPRPFFFVRQTMKIAK